MRWAKPTWHACSSHRIPGVFIAEYEEGEIGRDLPARVQRCEVRDAVGDRLAVQHEDANLLRGPTARHHHNQLFHAQRPLHLILFRVACNMGLEGIVSKRRDRAYAPGKCTHWVKTKNPAHPAYSRVRDQLLVARSRKSRAKP